MYPITVWSDFPRVNILRPLLGLWKAELEEVCRSEGVEGAEDTSQSSQNNVWKFLHKNEDLVPGIAQLMHTCQDVRSDLNSQGMIHFYTSDMQGLVWGKPELTHVH